MSGAAVTTDLASVIVVTYNSLGHIDACLTALQAAGAAVCVIDNASTDGTAGYVQQAFPECRLIVNLRNVGFAAAVNQGLATASGDVVVLVNPDCVVPPATLVALVEYLVAHPGVGVVGPRILDAAGVAAVSAHPFETVRSVVLSRFGGSVVPVAVRRLVSGADRRTAYDSCRSGTAAVSVDWLSGACLAVRRDLLTAVGGLAEQYFMYYEDEELCWQAHDLGFAVRLLPHVAVTHVGGASSVDPRQTWPHLYASMITFFARHRPHHTQVLRGVVVARAGLGMALGAARFPRDRTAARHRVAAWRSVARIAAGSGTAERRNEAPCIS